VRAEVWPLIAYDLCAVARPLTATLTKRLDAAHHRWQRSILGISWKNRITNVEVRTRTGQQTMETNSPTERKTTLLAWTCSAYGPPANIITISTVISRI